LTLCLSVFPLGIRKDGKTPYLVLWKFGFAEEEEKKRVEEADEVDVYEDE